MSVGNMTTTTVYPYFFQYQVRPNERNDGSDTLAGAIATVMVFAETDELARARAARHVGRNNWQIVEVKREMHILRHHVENMDGVLKSVYQQAEQAGIAAVFDGWKKPAAGRR
jgi:hypothetical protein